MVRDPDDKRRRLVDAAASEFAAHGIAGARVDRIAAAAGVSVGLVYTNFGNKDGLFDAVFDAIVARTMDEVPITPTDLPGYAVRLHDGYQAHPEVQRLAAWHRLERGAAGQRIPAIAASMTHKIDAIEQAQARGALTRRFPPVELLTLVLAISALSAATSPELGDLLPDPAAQGELIRSAVAALLA